MLKAWLSDHRGYINNLVIGVTTSDHFDQPGHSLVDMQVFILENVFKKEYETYRKKREKYFNSFYGGINREMWGGIGF